MGLDQTIWLVKMLQFTMIFLVSINQPGGKKVVYDYQSSFLFVIQVTVTCWNLVKFHFMLVNSSLLLGTSPFSSAKSSSLPFFSMFFGQIPHFPWPKITPKKNKVLRCFVGSTSLRPAPECSAGPRTAHRPPSPTRNSDAEPPPGWLNATPLAHITGRHAIGCLLGWCTSLDDCCWLLAILLWY